MNIFNRKKKLDNEDYHPKELTFEQASPIIQSMIKQVKCPYRIFSDQMTIREIMEQYEEAVKMGKKEGYIPVLVPEDDVLDEYFGILSDDDYSVEEAIKNMPADGAELLQNWLKSYTKPDIEGVEALNLDAFTGDIANGYEMDAFTAMRNFTNRGVKETVLFEIPTQNPWEVVAYVPFGGWNDCPAASDMAAVCKYWYEKYGAVPATITHDTLEFLLPKPVPEQEVMNVAKEHFAFCGDRLFQCTETGMLGEIADCVRQSKIWYFWWD